MAARVLYSGAHPPTYRCRGCMYTICYICFIIPSMSSTVCLIGNVYIRLWQYQCYWCPTEHVNNKTKYPKQQCFAVGDDQVHPCAACDSEDNCKRNTCVGTFLSRTIDIRPLCVYTCISMPVCLHVPCPFCPFV